MEDWFPTPADTAIAAISVSRLILRCTVFVARSPVSILCYPIYLTIAILLRMSTNLNSIDRKPAGYAAKPTLSLPGPHTKLWRLSPGGLWEGDACFLLS
ncbi:MAG: hypothetical protein JGK24_13585 [Microcoleus sp. PH2017_29_MFU_D_A]|uniref:hypothetical protein n=1 Tax=unclassified Microcoleus TaxID=2642155 RepID=UPI001E0B11F7|nr:MULTISPECIES: hypothetical protein [unclassified Microcoleus]MCC3417460.1 hypothetical protein [Microcoleus sp. PH2017_07_MST_O_A]MCC3422869.1 hypothetical protein [Microcoleus sp. PH2017_01_SCD_O_A]MCC3430131.1 hypothetical protein [Microcoleus sp. PH2017_04_SCI_O_A]MCC3505228.1 hypothetical protein [Microcoleus sp. PH2017_19_SFW_U_A]MCC3566833.1 hypothetical protein [Microcoleus sp. PH2017_31_RDM_U_A]MCC3571995.1 hypothetical protein [Microcoleus sp. PH2017_34_RAT_O_A]MCC3624669.1 hypot